METNINLKEKQKVEADARIKILKLFPTAETEFIEEGKLNLSECGMLFWLNEQEQELVDNWEEETGNLVYHIIKTKTEFGLLYSFLYVSKREEEWETDLEELKEGYPVAYVHNANDEYCSEYGGICIKSVFGGVMRIA